VIATVVGTVLVGVNQGSVLGAGRLSPLVWVRIDLDYLSADEADSVPALLDTGAVRSRDGADSSSLRRWR
jgi:hypothetical protein